MTTELTPADTVVVAEDAQLQVEVLVAEIDKLRAVADAALVYVRLQNTGGADHVRWGAKDALEAALAASGRPLVVCEAPVAYKALATAIVGVGAAHDLLDGVGGWLPGDGGPTWADVKTRLRGIRHDLHAVLARAKP